MQKGEIYSITVNSGAHISYHLFSLSLSRTHNFFCHPFRSNELHMLQSMLYVTVAFDHSHSESICKTGDENYNHSIAIVRNFLPLPHGCKWILPFDQRSNWLFFSLPCRIFLGSYKPFVDNIINIKYFCSHQYTFSNIFQHCHSNVALQCHRHEWFRFIMAKSFIFMVFFLMFL